MDRNQLRTALKMHGIRLDAYSLDDGTPNEAYCLEKRDGRWVVYYSERGEKKSDIESFDNECDACEYFLKLMKSEPSTRIP